MDFSLPFFPIANQLSAYITALRLNEPDVFCPSIDLSFLFLFLSPLSLLLLLAFVDLIKSRVCVADQR